VNFLAERAIVVSPRFCGPPRSANGGYVAGRLAAFLQPGSACAAEVTLWSPPPLDVRLEVADDDGGLALRSPKTLVAQAKTATLEADAPEPISYEEAVDAAARYVGRHYHPFPTCFGCGLERAPGDAMLLEAGAVDSRDGRPLVAAAWVPHESLSADSDGGVIRQEFAWSALDCPSGWATSGQGRPVVLGRMTTRVLTLPKVGQPCVVVGRCEGVDGRKAFTTSALYSADGELLGHARATWLSIDPENVRPA
jgi:hypothetical protein